MSELSVLCLSCLERRDDQAGWITEGLQNFRVSVRRTKRGLQPCHARLRIAQRERRSAVHARTMRGSGFLAVSIGAFERLHALEEAKPEELVRLAEHACRVERSRGNVGTRLVRVYDEEASWWW